MNRKNFALTYLLPFPLLMIFLWPLNYVSNPTITIIGVIIAVAIALIIMVISILRRLDNIGKSKLWLLGVFVPLLNFYTLPMLFSYPCNVKENGMDKKGYLIFFLVLFIAISIWMIQLVINAANLQG